MSDGCQEQLDSMYAAISKNVSEAFDAVESAEDDFAQEEAREQLEDVLGYAVRKSVRWTLAYGGPNAWIDAVYADAQYGVELESATFHATWWGNRPTEVELSEEDPLWRWADHMGELLSLVD